MQFVWSGIIPLQEKEYRELMARAEILGDISAYPENKFGSMTVLDYLDLVEMQAEHYTRTALVAEEELKAIKKLVEKGPYPHDNLEDYQQAVDDWLGKMMNIMEDES